MAGMRFVVGVVLLTSTLVLLAPAGARAGTYDVVSCNAPGAGGVNHSLAYAATSFDPQYNGQVGGWYEADGSCADGLIARSRTVDGTVAKWLTGGDWRFDAPAGTEIVAFSSWRFGEARDSGGDDPNTTLVDEGDHWRVEVVDASGQPIGGPGGGETCAHPVGADLCTIGVPGGQRADHRLVTNHLRWQATCGGEITGGCPTSYGGYPLATMVVYGTHITLQDDSAPTASLAGPLLAPGWHKPGEPVSYTAADNSGVRSATLSAGSANATDARACDFTYRVPCSNATNRPLQFSQPLPDGQYPVRLTVTDAAGNARAIEAPVSIDGSAPAVDLRPPRGRTLVVGAKDHASGFAAGQILVRNRSAEPYRALPTTYRRGKLRARLDRGNPRRVDLQVTVRDNAGNELTGAPARFRITSVTSQRLRAKVRRGGRVRVKFGRPVTIRGQLVLSGRRPVEGVPITVTTTPRVAGAAPSVEATGTVGANGRFVVRLGKGPARTASIAFPGVPGELPAERRLRLAVPASSTIKASRLRLRGAGLVRFRGSVRGGAGANLVVVLQGKENGKWRTFADTRTRKAGRWSASYRFSGRPGDYPIRVRVRRQANLPYETGHSPRVTVHVG
jgi:hypothetical protein